MSAIPSEETNARIHRLQQLLAEADVDGALIVQHVDLYYFTGTIQQSHLYVPATGEPLLMTRKGYERARADSPLDRVVPLRSQREIPALLSEFGLPRPRRLGLEFDVLPTAMYLNFQRLFPETELVDASMSIRRTRMVKSTFEIDILRRSAAVGAAMAQAAAENLQEGMTELELLSAIESAGRRAGHQALVRTRGWNQEIALTLVLAGENGAYPGYLDAPLGGSGPSPAMPFGASYRRIRRGEPVIVDYVTAVDGYFLDHSRVFSIGPLPDELARGHEAMVAIQNELKQRVRPGTTGAEAWDYARARAVEMGYADVFMGHGSSQVFFVGHGIGLEVDEYPALARGVAEPVQEGMVLAIEPKLIFPGVGAVGIENTHVVTAEGLVTLTLPPDPIVQVG